MSRERFHSRYVIAFSGIALAVSAGAYSYTLSRRIEIELQPHRAISPPSSKAIPNKMAVTTPFQTLFAVPMTCDGCAKDITDALYKLPGINKVEANVKDQLVSIEGTAAPSAIVAAIQATGRDAILRGSGSSNSAAVSILETYHHHDGHTQEQNDANVTPDISSGSWVNKRLVRGLARMVQVSPTETVVDLTVRGVPPGTYRATIREYGNLKEGAESTGPVWASTTSSAASENGGSRGPRGYLGTIEVGPNGYGSAFINRPFQVWEVIGRALVVSRKDEEAEPLKNEEDTVVGVIARSAGVWDNDKTVCSCTGKTLWEERKDEVAKGML